LPVNIRKEKAMSMSVGGVKGAAPAAAPSGAEDAAPQEAINKGMTKIAMNILQSGQSYMREAMENFFKEEEPDEDDPDAEPL
jgi:hypothetical protein